jgi:hypothetical protein
VSRVERIYAILPFVVLVVLGAAFVVVFRERAAARRAWSDRRVVESDLATPPRNPVAATAPWWRSMWLWVAAACVTSLALGYVLWPGLLAVPAVVLPLAWLRRPRRERPVDPRANGHATRGGPGAFGTG